jgi:hypothetical protein
MLEEEPGKKQKNDGGRWPGPMAISVEVGVGWQRAALVFSGIRVEISGVG